MGSVSKKQEFLQSLRGGATEQTSPPAEKPITASTSKKQEFLQSLRGGTKNITSAPAPKLSREEYIYGATDMSKFAYKTAGEYDAAIADLQSQVDAARNATKRVVHPATQVLNNVKYAQQNDELKQLQKRMDALQAEKTLFDRATAISSRYGNLDTNADYAANKGVQRHDDDPTYIAVNKDVYDQMYPKTYEGQYGWVDGGWVTDENADELAAKYGWDLRERQNRIAAAVAGQQDAAAEAGEAAIQAQYGELSWMTDQERDNYNYLYQTDGADAAMNYLEQLKPLLQRRSTAATEYDTAEEYKNAGWLGKAAMNAGTLLTRPIGTAIAAINDLSEAAGGEYSPYGSAHTLQTIGDTVRGETAKDIYAGVEKGTGSEGLAQLTSTLYQGGMSAADAALGGLALGPGYLAVAGADAATHKARELYESGAEDWQIAVGSVASGAIEAMMEKVPLDKLLDMAGGTSGVRTMVKNILRQGGIEAGEEALTEIANITADSILQGGNSDLSRQIAAYEQEGYTPEQARQMAARDKATDVLWSAVAGMAGGFGSATAFGTVGLAKDHQAVRNVGNIYLQGMNGNTIDRAVERAEQATVKPEASETVSGAAVLETAIRSQMQGRKESQVQIRNKDDDVGVVLDELARELGEEELLRRMYNAAQINRPTGKVEIDGQRVDANAYIDAYEQALPEDPAALEQTIKRLEQERTAEIARMATEENLENYTFGGLKIDLQLFAARRKWDMLQLEPGEEGTETRQFYEKRLRGTDANHHQELVDLLAGRSETYNPIANEKTLERANGKLRSDKYKRRLMQRIGRYNPHDLFNTVDVAAAQVLINDALNDGEWQVAMDLITGLSRKGTELGRAVQAFSMMARMTPEGTLRAAQRTIKAEADYVIGEGASDGLDVLADDIAGALARLARLKGMDAGVTAADGEHTGQETVWDGTVGNGNPNMEGATREQLVNALAEDLADTEGTYLSKEQIQEALQKVITDSTNVPEQVKRYVLKKIRKNDGALANRLYEVQQKGHLNATETRRALEEALELPTLTDGDVQKLVELSTKAQSLSEDPVAQADAMDEIYDFLGAKMSVNWMDRLQAWRKFGMLANVKTHARNVLSNAAYMGVRKADEAMAMALERIFVRDKSKWTAALGWSHTEHGQKILPALQKRAEEAVLEMQHRGAKYETGTGQLKTRRKFFGESKVGEALNSANRGNSDLLEREDVWFFKPAYINALGQIMTARGETEITEQMHATAMQRALEATFRADNAISEVISSLKRYQNGSKAGSRLFGQAVDVVIPFHKTPANIAIQTVLHSPVGIAKGAFDLVQAIRGKGGASTAQIINEFAKGITGTALMGIGLLLGTVGMFNTGFGKTEKERAADELAGRQENALMFGDVSVSMDWLQPAASPLIVGASMGQRLQEGGFSLGEVFGAVMDGTDSLFEMTMLQSLYDILGGYDAGASATAASVVENVVSQSIPTVVGQAARAIDPVQRKTTGDSDFETLVNQVMAKIPGLTYLLDPELDVWGEEVYRTGKPSEGTAALNILQQLALPANTKVATGKDDRVSREILRLYDKEGSGAIPTAITRDEARDNGLDYVDANKDLGAANRQAVEDFINDRWPYQVQVTGANGKRTNVTKFYSEMTDEERRRVLSRIYTQKKKAITEPEEEDTYFQNVYRRLNNGNS